MMTTVVIKRVVGSKDQEKLWKSDVWYGHDDAIVEIPIHGLGWKIWPDHKPRQSRQYSNCEFIIAFQLSFFLDLTRILLSVLRNFAPVQTYPLRHSELACLLRAPFWRALFDNEYILIVDVLIPFNHCELLDENQTDRLPWVSWTLKYITLHLEDVEDYLYIEKNLWKGT